MSKAIIALIVCLLAAPSFAAEPPKSDEQKTLYAIGLFVARQLTVFDLTPAELEIVKQGITDAGTGKRPEVELDAYKDKVQQLARERRKALGEKQAAANKGFLEKEAKEKGAIKTESGLIYIPEKEGTGATPGATDTVTVNYRGTLPDGTEFDSSAKRGKPLEFKVNGVIKCWSEGVQKMKVGGKAKLVCPPQLAYGDTGAGDVILPGATLVFDVELLGTKK